MSSKTPGQIIAELAQDLKLAAQQRDALLKMLERLNNEVKGLKTFPVNDVIGNTNWNVLMTRADEAGKLIEQVKGRE